MCLGDTHGSRDVGFRGVGSQGFCNTQNMMLFVVKLATSVVMYSKPDRTVPGNQCSRKLPIGTGGIVARIVLTQVVCRRTIRLRAIVARRREALRFRGASQVWHQTFACAGARSSRTKTLILGGDVAVEVTEMVKEFSVRSLAWRGTSSQ